MTAPAPKAPEGNNAIKAGNIVHTQHHDIFTIDVIYEHDAYHARVWVIGADARYAEAGARYDNGELIAHDRRQARSVASSSRGAESISEAVHNGFKALRRALSTI